MLQNLRLYWDELLAGTWFIPSVIACGAVPLALLALALDSLAGDAGGAWLKLLYVSAPEEARNVLSTLLSSMMTMASLVFSSTMVVLTLASRQFGPRMLREFMSSPMTQFVLGIYVMTIVYCLLILGSTGSDQRTGSVPHPSVTIGITLTLGNTVLLVFFLHSLGRSLMSESIITRIGGVLNEYLSGLQPLDSVEPAEDRDARDAEQPCDAARFGTDESGYVQAIVASGAIRAARDADARVILDFRPGDYVVKGGQNIAVCPANHCSEELRAALKKAIVLGPHRTPLQDPLFPIRHLVEIALRALSPGVNDPYTATAVLDGLSSFLSRLMGLALPSGVVRDSMGVVRIVWQVPTHATMLEAAFDQIRQNSGDKPLVLIHMIGAIARLVTHARLLEHVQLLTELLDTLEREMNLRLEHPRDIESVKARLRGARADAEAQRRRLAGRSA